MQNEELIKKIQENITILTASQVRKGFRQLKVLKQFGISSSITDFASILGGFYSDHLFKEYNDMRKERAGHYFLKTSMDGKVLTVYDNEMFPSEPTKSFFSIRPVISYKDIPNALSNVTELEDGLFQVEFGEYPQFAVKQDKCKELEEALEQGKLKKTGKEYHIPYDYNYSNPDVFEEYEYEDKRYIRIKQNIQPHRCLSTGEVIAPGTMVWIEVSPIEWLVDQEKELLVSKRLLAAGIQMLSHRNYQDEFVLTNVYKFLTELFARDMISTDTKEKEKERPKIEAIIKQIYFMQDVMIDKEKTLQEVSEIIAKHNQKLDALLKDKKNNNYAIESLDSITYETELKLKIILESLKERREKLKVYFEMMDDVNDYIAILTGKEPKEGNELSDEFYVLEQKILPFLKEEDQKEIKELLLNVLYAQKQEIQDYIDGTGKIKYHTVEDMTLDLRREIHPVIEKINNEVNNRNIEKEIQESIEKIITGLYETPKNRFIAIYLTEINKTYNMIILNINKIPKDMKAQINTEVSEIMNRKIDYSKDFLSISRELMNMWLSLNRIYNIMSNYTNEIDRIRGEHINLEDITMGMD